MIYSPSIYDVAKKAGVSHMTVSNTLNRPDGGRLVASTTAERVRKAAAELGYVANQAARNLSLGRTREIVFATPASLRYAHIHDLVEELLAALAIHRYRLDLELFRQLGDVPDMYRTFTKGRCDGVILHGVSSEHREALESMQQRGMPVVVAMDPLGGASVDRVDQDRPEEARLGTAHLLAQGHARVVLIVHKRGYPSEEQRVQGYRRTLEENGSPFDESLILTRKVGTDVLPLWRQIRRLKPAPTAIMCYNAEMSVQLEGVMRRHGVRIPEDMALVSLGDALVNTLAEVPVTAVNNNLHEVAVKVVERLLAQIAHPRMPPRHMLVKPFLVERASSATRAFRGTSQGRPIDR